MEGEFPREGVLGCSGWKEPPGTCSFQPKMLGIVGLKSRRGDPALPCSHPIGSYSQNSQSCGFGPFPNRGISPKTTLKWDHRLDPDIPSWSRFPKSLLGEVIPTIPWIHIWDGPKSRRNREYQRRMRIWG